MKASKPLLLVLCLLLLSTQMFGDVLGATGGGFYAENGMINGTDNNYIAGQDAGGLFHFHNWFTFDLSGVTGPIASATLTLHSPAGVQGSGTYYVYAPTTDPSLLGTVADVGIYNDLASGPVLGSVTYECTAPTGPFGCVQDEYFTITLNATGVADVNAALGGMFVLSGDAVASDYIGGESFIFGYTDHAVGVGNTLTVAGATVPEPTSGFMTVAGMVGLVARLRRWGKRA